MQRTLLLAFSILALVSCGPAARNHGGDDDDDDGTDAHNNNGDAGSGSNISCTSGGTAEVCDDGIDNDCDGKTDCSDPDCSGIDGCPVCGSAAAPDATPIDLPDGVSSGQSCSTDADCSGGTPNCIIAHDEDNNNAPIKECHASYTSTLHFIGFGSGQMLTDPTKLKSVCIDIEHSYLHDLQMELLSPPDGTGTRLRVVLQDFQGRIGPKIFVGIPNDDDGENPIPGTTQHYCFDPTMGSTVMYDAPFDQETAPDDGLSADHVPPGNYKPASGTNGAGAAFAPLQGAELNGDWTVRVTDMFAIDNGTLKGWTINWDSSLISDCSGPIVGIVQPQ